jgi:hypothetical protein
MDNFNIIYGGGDHGKASKALEVLMAITGTARAIDAAFKDYPKAKRGRRITKNFKHKRRLFWAKLGITGAMGFIQVARIAEQPVPKYPKGGFIGDTGKPEIVHGDFDIPYTVQDDINHIFLRPQRANFKDNRYSFD